MHTVCGLRMHGEICPFDPVAVSGLDGWSSLLAWVFAHCASGLGDLLVRCMVQRSVCMGMFQLCSVLHWKADAALQAFLLCPLKFRIDTSQKFHNQLGLLKFILMLPLLSMPLSTWKCTARFCLRIRSYIYWCGTFVGYDWTLMLCHNSVVL